MHVNVPRVARSLDELLTGATDRQLLSPADARSGATFERLAPETIAPELEVADVPGPVRVADQGWALLPGRAPDLDTLVRGIHADPHDLAEAMRTTPSTFVAGDWKLGNLGSRPDGRTIVLDWAYPGQAPPCWELAWYLALNRSRLPEAKEATIERYRRGLERRGVRDRRLVGPAARTVPGGHHGDVRVGEGSRRRGRAGLVELGCAGRCPVAGVSHDLVRGAYRGAARSWADDASLAYVPLARHLLAHLGGGLPGRRALDAGAGTGAAGDLLRELGADVVSVDLEPDMLRHRLDAREHAVVGDVARLPLRSRHFDVVVAGFVLNHVADHVAALRELGRVTRRGGVVLASVFANERSALKEAVDEQLLAFGWSPPEWYVAVRERSEAVGTTELFEARARDAELDGSVRSAAVDVGLDTPELVVRYRLAMAHCRSFVAGLADHDRRALVREAVAAVAATHEPFRPVVLELVATVR